MYAITDKTTTTELFQYLTIVRLFGDKFETVFLEELEPAETISVHKCL